MIEMTMAEVASAVGGVLHGATLLDHCDTDSRSKFVHS